MRTSHRAGVAAGALAVLLAVSGCTSSGTGPTGPSFQAGDGTITVVAPQQRKQAVDLRGAAIDGTPVDLAAYRGGVVVLNVWASWCPPCQEEAPALQAASEALAPKGVKFLGINTRENGNKAQAEAFERTYGITYPSLFDSSDYLLALRGAVAANALPSTVVLDAQGRVAARISGRTTKATLVDIVDSVISSQEGA
ncbi:MAG TPA: TlpA disulfide reductase family protein [Kineosporiaceae bacterium]|jgi:thiol-disulfide isomerase/thioredoxin|nr:TlpA disulfide reductase family protein [Kineosporiaceae bacterium]